MRYFASTNERHRALSRQWDVIAESLTMSQFKKLMSIPSYENKALNLHKVTKNKKILAHGERLLEIARLPVMQLLVS